MRRWSLAILVVLLMALPLSAADWLVQFDGGIGVIPTSRTDATTGAGTRNVVRGVQPGGQPWVISRLQATVFADGRVLVDGRGLLLAGGDTIGSNGNQSVRARLFCGTESFITTGDAIPLDAAGDFRIDGQLSAVPPNPCDSPVLLIVNAGGAWFAAGIPKQ